MSTQRTNSTERWYADSTPVSIEVDTVFDTPFETGCRVTVVCPDSNVSSNFMAIDSDGVECEFSTVMVIGHPDYVKTMWS